LNRSTYSSQIIVINYEINLRVCSTIVLLKIQVVFSLMSTNNSRIHKQKHFGSITMKILSFRAFHHQVRELVFVFGIHVHRSVDSEFS